MILRFALLLLPAFCTGQWIECDGVSSVKAGSCNSAAAPCKAGSGVFNAGKVTDIETCEGICEQPQHPGCVAVQFHGPHVRGWAGVCLLSNQSAWDPRPQTVEVGVVVVLQEVVSCCLFVTDVIVSSLTVDAVEVGVVVVLQEVVSCCLFVTDVIVSSLTVDAVEVGVVVVLREVVSCCLFVTDVIVSSLTVDAVEVGVVVVLQEVVSCCLFVTDVIVSSLTVDAVEVG
eukprot:gene10386-28143_t